MLLASLDRLRALPRLLEIVRTLVHYGLHDMIHSVGIHRVLDEAGHAFGWDADPAIAQQPLEERVRLALEALGPAFVKLGQVLSSRVDLLGPEWITSLDRLHDRATPVPFAAIEGQLIADLGRPVAEVFESFDAHAAAAGSVAQVHRATLAGGDEVAVKIRRPGIVAPIEADMLLLETLASWWEEEQPEARRFQPAEIVRQLRRSLAREIDFAAEARAQQRFAESFAGDEHVLVPKVRPELTRASLLVMDWVDGVAGTDLALLDERGFDRQRLAGLHVDMVLQMVLVDGMFHADPHPGNVFFLPGDRVALIDFGMVGWLSSKRRDELTDLLAALAARDAEGMRDVLLGWADGRRVSAERFSEDLGRLLHMYEHAQLREVRLDTLLAEIAAIMREHHLLMPVDLAMLFKALITLEGFGTRLVPRFRLIEHVTPRVEALIRSRYDPRRVAASLSTTAGAWARALRSAPRMLEALAQRFGEDGVALRLEVRELDSFSRQLERSVNRATIGIVTAALIVGSSILVAASPGRSLLMAFLSFGGVAVSFAIGLWLLVSIHRSRRS